MVTTNKIWNLFAEELKGFILQRINDDDQADDILQDVFVKIHLNIDKLEDKTKIRAWIYQITRNVIIDYYRKVKPKGELSDIIAKDEFNEENPTELVAHSIREMIMTLPKKYAIPLCMNECDGIAQKDIAEKLGLSFSGAKSRIQRARLMIRDELMKCCHYEFDKYGSLIDYHPINCCCCSALKEN